MSDDPVEPQFSNPLNILACAVDGVLNGKAMPPKVGFGLFVFDLNDPTQGTQVNYISNCERDSMKRAMQEWINRN